LFSNGLKKGVAFIDYESWYVSMTVNYGTKPNIKAWFEGITQKVNLTEAVFFADFSHKSLADEIKRIRPYSNKIIDTRNPTGVKKDFTDFIILDNIYQKAMMSEGIDVFILFSGDGHFSSATSFLKNICGKEVGIYGVRGSFSRQLQETASWCVTLPTEEEMQGNDYQLIFGELRNSKSMLSADALIDTVVNKNKSVKKQSIAETLSKLQKDGTVIPRTVGQNKDILFVDWEKAEKEGYLKEI
jgi:uncharacterized LabA/DUF88 family protein